MTIRMAWLRWVGMAAASAALAACGGGTTTANDDDGSSTGGVGTGGSSTGGSSTGGSSTGGSSTGGSSTGGVGTGGSTASTLCDDYCAVAVAAGCDSPSDADSCALGCNVMIGVAECATVVDAALTCASAATATCDTDGSVTFAGCEAEQLAVAACFAALEPPAELVDPCNAYCDAVAAAACPNDDPATCPADCGIIGIIAPSCIDSWAAYVNCASADTMTCDTDGTAQSSSCTTESLTAFACALTALGTSG